MLKKRAVSEQRNFTMVGDSHRIKGMTSDAEAIVTDSAKRLFPSLSKDEALASLLLEKAQRNPIKYQSQARQFKDKYEQPFDDFRRLLLDGEPNPEEEQGYFDWELAVTGAEDMKLESDRIK
ncbi:MAG: hypothetical protein LC131_03820 [Anaerolineae bacterium]|nr:hypothetical protein [Anaerolineae bacterium]